LDAAACAWQAANLNSVIPKWRTREANGVERLPPTRFSDSTHVLS
jgi:hypothetical protein